LINKFLLYRKSRGTYEDTGEEAPELDEGFFVDYLVYYLVLNLEAGVEYKFKRGFTLGFYPSFEMSFLNKSNIGWESKFKQRYILMGLNVSLTYNL